MKLKTRIQMKKGLIICITLFMTQIVFSQQKSIDNKQQIKKVLETFMNAIETKDSIKMYSLFMMHQYHGLVYIKKPVKIRYLKKTTRK